MKIGFVTDTNIIRKCDGDLSKGMILDTTDIFIEYIDALKKIDMVHTLTYFMPEIIIRELFAQKTEYFRNELEKLDDIYKKIKYGLSGEFPKNIIDEKLKEEKEKYFGKYRIITLESSKELMNELIDDSINKVPPFDKSVVGKKTDAGFKDALIWKTILRSKEVGECDLFYFFSSDKSFESGEETLMIQFNEYHPKTKLKIICVAPDGNQRQEALRIIIQENELKETEVVKLYNKKYILSQFVNVKYNLSKEIYYPNNGGSIKLNNILFDNFTEDDFVIDDVVKFNHGYEVFIIFKTYKYKLDCVEAGRILLQGNIKMHFEIKNDKIVFQSYNIENVMFKQIFKDEILEDVIDNIYSIDSNEYRLQLYNLLNRIEMKKKIKFKNKFNDFVNNVKSYNDLYELYDYLLKYNELTQSKYIKNEKVEVDDNKI